MTRLAKHQQRKQRQKLLESMVIAVMIGSVGIAALVLAWLNHLALNGITYF
jgi:hypothetical protein